VKEQQGLEHLDYYLTHDLQRHSRVLLALDVGIDVDVQQLGHYALRISPKTYQMAAELEIPFYLHYVLEGLTILLDQFQYFDLKFELFI
jgi:hypothetical protein